MRDSTAARSQPHAMARAMEWMKRGSRILSSTYEKSNFKQSNCSFTTATRSTESFQNKQAPNTLVLDRKHLLPQIEQRRKNFRGLRMIRIESFRKNMEISVYALKIFAIRKCCFAKSFPSRISTLRVLMNSHFRLVVSIRTIIR